MSLNIQIESLEESSSIVDLPSNEDDLVSEQIEIPAERPETPDTDCPICLEKLTNKCHSESCWHLFCFDCLKEWSDIQPSCPLCKNRFETIRHTLSDTGMGVTYEVPIQERELSPRSFSQPFIDISVNGSGIYRIDEFLDIIRRNRRPMTIYTTSLMPISRIIVYSDNMWAEPLPDFSGRLRVCTLTFYRNYPIQSQLLHDFIARDLIAILSLQRPDDINRLSFNEEIRSLTLWVVQSVILYEIRDPVVAWLLRPYLGDHATHFFHELYNFATSPYDISTYDSFVRFSNHGYFYRRSGFHAPNTFDQVPTPFAIRGIFNHSQTIIKDSNEIIVTGTRRFTQEMIVISSSSEDSDVEITDSSRPIEVLDSSVRDQPSTSTGIRDSLDRPNNSSSSEDSDVEITDPTDSSRPIEVLDSSFRDQPSTSTGIRDSLDRPNNSSSSEDSDVEITDPTDSSRAIEVLDSSYRDQPSTSTVPISRIIVYSDNMWAEPLPDFSGRLRVCTLTFYRNYPIQSQLLHDFIARDLIAILSLQRPDDINRLSFNEEIRSLTLWVVQSVILYEIRDPVVAWLLRPYLGDHAAHFFHELYNFATSPYDISTYDSFVRFSNHGYFYRRSGFHAPNTFDQVPTPFVIRGIFNHSQTIIKDSNEIIVTGTRRFTQEMIVISSSSEDSDVEITDSSRPIEVLDSSVRDQPSTSTGIRDSLDRPNNSSSSEDSDVEITDPTDSSRPIEVLDSSFRDQPSTSTGIRDSLDRPNNSSSSEDSDVEITDPTDSSRPIEVLDSSYRDQPSTSTGIRDSLDRPNNRFNLRRRRFISPIESPSCPVHQLAYSPSLRREKIILDSSSDELIMSNRDSQGKKGRRKNKHKKKKTNSDDTRPEILCTGTRSRSYSGSSSSGDTDSSPNNNNCGSVQTNVVM